MTLEPDATAPIVGAAEMRTPLYVSPASGTPPLRMLLLTPSQAPAWLAAFLADAKACDWLDVHVVVDETNGSTSASKGLPPDLRAYLALDRLRRRHRRFGMLARVDISGYAQRTLSDDGAPARDVLAGFDADIVLLHGDAKSAPALAERARLGCWRIGDDIGDPRSTMLGLAPLLDGELATSIELLLDFDSDRRVVLAAGNVATQAGSFTLQREQILHKLPGLLLGALRDLRAGKLEIAQRATAVLHLAGSDRVFSFGSGWRAFGVWLRHTLRWRRRIWRGEDPWFVAMRTSTVPLDPVAPVVGDIAALVAPAGRYWADPCVIEYQGRRLIFVESFGTHESKGVIVCLELLADNTALRLGIVLEKTWHLSYPQVFEFEGTWYLTVESGSVRRASLYRAAGFPLVWEFVCDLLGGCQCVDPTLYRKDDHWYLFAGVSERGGSTCDDLFLFVASSLEGPYLPHPSNPIVRDVRRARPAGRLFERDGKLIRPAQDCAPDYGSAIVFNEVLELTPTRYRERELSRISPTWLPELWGCHTYCDIPGTEIIDGRGQLPPIARWIPVTDAALLTHATNISLPIVTVLMPVYNGERYIAEAIDSVLAQTLAPIEVVVVDDGSLDSSGAIADRYAAEYPGRVRVVHQSNAGLPLARNAAIAAARGRYLALLDADDVWLPEHLSLCVDALERNPSVALVHADAEYIDAESQRFAVDEEPRWGREARDPYAAVLLRRQHVVCPTAVFRRSVVDRVGGFDAAFNRLGCEDRDLWLRIAEVSDLQYIEGVQARYRVHSANMSGNSERMWRARKLLVEKHAERARGRPLLRRARAAIDADHGHELAREPAAWPALQAFACALCRDPLRIDAWKGLLRRILVGRRPGAIVRR